MVVSMKTGFEGTSGRVGSLRNKISFAGRMSFIWFQFRFDGRTKTSQGKTMAVSHQDKLIFVHVPKNGGTSIIEGLGLGEHGHHAAFSARIQSLKSSLGYRTFSVCRNPYDRFISTYRFYKASKSFWHSDDGSTPYKMLPEHSIVKDMTLSQFGDWVRNEWMRGALKYHLHLLPQTSHTHDVIGRSGVDLWIRMEDGISEGLSRLCEREIVIPRLNATSDETRLNATSETNSDGNGKCVSQCPPELTRSVIEIVNEIYKKDFDLLGYEIIRHG